MARYPSFYGGGQLMTFMEVYSLCVNSYSNLQYGQELTGTGTKWTVQRVVENRGFMAYKIKKENGWTAMVFRGTDDPHPGHWLPTAVPAPFPDTPEGSVLGKELIMVARRGLDNLPERQRVVVTMRDMLGLDSDEVCELLEISAANQRVLLHRGRAAFSRGQDRGGGRSHFDRDSPIDRHHGRRKGGG